MESIVVTSAVRTPIGKLGGGLKDVPPENLTKLVIKEAVNKSGVKKELIDEVIIGQTKQTTDAPNIARVFKIDESQCSGCRVCQVICSLKHFMWSAW